MSTASSEGKKQISIDQVSDELLGHKRDFDEKMAQATTLADAEALRREYLGKKGPINKVMGYMRLLSDEDKPKLGAVVNNVKTAVEESVAQKMVILEFADIQRQMKEQRVDVTKPGLTNSVDIGRRHPLSMTMEKALDIFVRLGYDTVTDCQNSPEIETDYYCFEALNCPKDHPARDMQDTFYLTQDREYLLRTHTSSVQIRYLEKHKPPFRIVAPGRVYRRDDIDATHALMFHQVEILALEKRGQLDLGHLKGTVEYFLKGMFGPNIQVRFRGSYFPFTEPSMEVDVFFRGKWLEVLGCGMVDPRVLEKAGIDPEEYSGFAAGFGLERFAMVIHQITDLREFTKNDARFVRQFPHFYDDGLPMFLKGEMDNSPVDDPRGETVPQPFVGTLDELCERVASSSDAVNGGPAVGAEIFEEPKEERAPETVTDIDISKLDIRVGLIKKAWEHPDADKLYCEEIDLGEASGPRRIASGLRAHCSLNELEGRKVLVLANLKERKLVGFPSHGMVLCATNDDGQVALVNPPESARVGERVVVEGFHGEPATENQVIKKRMLDAIFPELTTNDDGVATYRGKPILTSAGPCKSELPNASIS